MVTTAFFCCFLAFSWEWSKFPTVWKKRKETGLFSLQEVLRKYLFWVGIKRVKKVSQRTKKRTQKQKFAVPQTQTSFVLREHSSKRLSCLLNWGKYFPSYTKERMKLDRVMSEHWHLCIKCLEAEITVFLWYPSQWRQIYASRSPLPRLRIRLSSVKKKKSAKRSPELFTWTFQTGKSFQPWD